MFASHESRKMFKLGTVFAAMLAFSGAASAVDFYKTKVFNLTARTNGDVVVIVTAGTGETRFVDERAKILLAASEAGQKVQVATVLSAVALAAELTMALNDPPSRTLQQPFQIALDAPAE